MHTSDPTNTVMIVGHDFGQAMTACTRQSRKSRARRSFSGACFTATALTVSAQKPSFALICSSRSWLTQMLPHSSSHCWPLVATAISCSSLAIFRYFSPLAPEEA